MTAAILISGCQRSGTTLMNLVFDSHPQVRGVDETYFRRYFTLTKLRDRLADEHEHALMSFKIPMQSHLVGRLLDQLESPPRAVWMLRDPRAVIASMVDLHLPLPSNRFVSVSWAASFIHKEIINVLQALPESWLAPFEEWIHRFRLIENTPSILRPAEDIYFTAALCWRLKLLTLDWHELNEVPLRLVRYEQLVGYPETTLRGLLADLDIDWDEQVLFHDRHARVGVIGGTLRDRPISPDSLDKWRQSLPASALTVVAEVCAEAAAARGYEL